MKYLIKLLHIPTAKLVYYFKFAGDRWQLPNNWSFELFNKLKCELTDYELYDRDGKLVLSFKLGDEIPNDGHFPILLEHIEVIPNKEGA